MALASGLVNLNLVDVTTANLTGLALTLSLADAFTPAIGDTFTLFYASEAIVLTAVPEPAHFAMLAGALLLGFVLIRRR